MTDLSNDSALVLFSAGQDSTTCLAWALERFSTVETIGYDYGQRHVIELAQRPAIREALARRFPQWSTRLQMDHTLGLSALSAISETALTRQMELTFDEDRIPNTFVPGRNIIFLTLAAALAYRRGIKHIVAGMCETDYSGYPDCRDDTIKAMQVALNLGMDRRFVLHTPLMFIDKAGTWDMAEALGGQTLVEIVRTETHSCYLGVRETLHDWGYGCGTCPACELRADGWKRYRSRKKA